MLGWIQLALKKLSHDEFVRVMKKVEGNFGEGCKIDAVHRLEDNTVRVNVELANSQRRMIIL